MLNGWNTFDQKTVSMNSMLKSVIAIMEEKKCMTSHCFLTTEYDLGDELYVGEFVA